MLLAGAVVLSRLLAFSMVPVDYSLCSLLAVTVGRCFWLALVAINEFKIFSLNNLLAVVLRLIQSNSDAKGNILKRGGLQLVRVLNVNRGSSRLIEIIHRNVLRENSIYDHSMFLRRFRA